MERLPSTKWFAAIRFLLTNQVLTLTALMHTIIHVCITKCTRLHDFCFASFRHSTISFDCEGRNCCIILQRSWIRIHIRL